MAERTEAWKPIYREALGFDPFVAEHCVRCGYKGTAWADGKGGIAIRCPRCLRDRVRALRAAHGSLPGAVDYLEKMADGDIRRQSWTNLEALTVDLDLFLRCADCDRLILKREARYWLPEGASSSPPYCTECWEARRG